MMHLLFAAFEKMQYDKKVLHLFGYLVFKHLPQNRCLLYVLDYNSHHPLATMARPKCYKNLPEHDLFCTSPCGCPIETFWK